MVNKATNTSPVVVDDEYKEAIQPVVDNSMRTDILGPHFCRILNDHSPAREAVVTLITKQIAATPELKTAIKSVVEEFNRESKMVWFERFLGAIGTIALGLAIWGIEHLITSTYPSNPNPAPVSQTTVTKPNTTVPLP